MVCLGRQVLTTVKFEYGGHCFERLIHMGSCTELTQPTVYMDRPEFLQRSHYFIFLVDCRNFGSSLVNPLCACSYFSSELIIHPKITRICRKTPNKFIKWTFHLNLLILCSILHRQNQTTEPCFCF